MLNREKFAKEILDIACNGYSLAVNRKNAPVPCSTISCNKCIFSDRAGILCTNERKNWCNSEYIELKTDWSKVPVDTPIFVRNFEEDPWYKRHFSQYTNENEIKAWCDGATSWSTEDSVSWKYAKLAREEDKLLYSKN